MMDKQVNEKLHTKMQSKVNWELQISAPTKYIYIKRSNFLPWKVYTFINMSLSLKYTLSGFNKHGQNMDVANDYVSLYVCPLQCWLAGLVVDLDYFVAKNMFERV